MSHSSALNPPQVEHDVAAIAEALAGPGACLIAGFPAPPLAAALREDLQRLQAEGALHTAGIGRADGHRQRGDLRGDRTLWLDDERCGAAARTYLGQLDALRLGLNRALFLGLRETEAHYALYAPGARYMRHRDRFRDSDARVVTVVGYLNPDWRVADGGELRLYDDDGRHRDIPPHDATSLCFLSEREHEVLVTHRPRMSIAAWLRR
ncbi:2OG-Fe(II) oxygenase [Lysobacter pythonis]|uniref:2OG-Fe(II) oxygenase n=1 Tax=Solilutibacter pythonis TaxID=2483112 RepID=A0A3M2HV53_9GAMM|nr:2OG-Fe(II) oxygenase [Lysobacter pythonis]RMH93611.1 2OG-Fe(II) oxygenase [Lysobacter pythonis]